MEYFEINIVFVGHIVGIEFVLANAFPWQYFLPYAIPLHFCSNFVFFAAFVYNCSVDILGSSFFFRIYY